jgi:hypothetical protein
MTIEPVRSWRQQPTVRTMTEVIGLRLAYRGFISGLAASYAWLALAMLAGALLPRDPLAPLRPIAAALVPAAGDSPELAFVLGFALVQLGGATLGMLFAYFVGRFFTARATLTLAAASFAVLAWAVLAAGLGPAVGIADVGLRSAPLIATLAYGLMLGAGLPLRGEVLRDAA